jgi:uncharacterized repeat protein (TIGR01451 family)
MNLLTRMEIVQKSALALGFAVALFMAMSFSVQPAHAAQSPVGCTADNSVVNISSNAATAEPGDNITFTVTAGNPASGDGCDITNRTITLTLPDGSTFNYGPTNYPNPTPLTFVGDEVYVADEADLNNGFWEATVEWNGTLKSVSDIPSNGDKGISVLAILPLEVVKTVDTSFDRSWSWGIVKSADQTSLDLEADETATVNYEVELTATPDDSNHMVSGTITITNPNSNTAATVTGVSDLLDNSGSLDVDCGVTFPYELAGGADLVCTYSGESDGTDTLNTATVTTTGGISGGEDTEVVAFDSDPTTVTDECVTVNDTNSNFPGNTEVCADDSDKTIEYSVDFGPDGADVVIECGDGSHPNTADFITNDTQTTGDDEETVNWTVTCDVSCTLTQGYWKTHNDLFKGGAASDETWELLPSGEETIFFLSGKNWVTIFNTAPKGNVYYNLAHQYMAAKLNTLSGASVPSEVQDALDDAEAFFSANAPTATISKSMKAQLTSLAGTLGAYNEGEIGPGHCD